MISYSNYIEMNSRFGDPFVFCLTDRGFYSEVNVLLSAVFFGMVNRRRLIVDQSGFGGQRWSNFFTVDLLGLVDSGLTSTPDEWVIKGVFTPNFIRIRHFVLKRNKRWPPIWLPSAGLPGCPRTALREIALMLTTPKSTFVPLPWCEKGFSAIHIRRGDKVEGYSDSVGRVIIEGEETSPELYIDNIRRHAPQLQTVFVMTDDYSVIEDLEKLAPDLQFVTFCDPDERGHRQPDFNSRSPAEKEARLNRLIFETQLAIRSDLFLGGFKSNVSRYIALTHKDPKVCHSLDGVKKWTPA